VLAGAECAQLPAAQRQTAVTPPTAHPLNTLHPPPQPPHPPTPQPPPPPQLLYDTFSAFGVIVNTPKIMRDPDTGVSKGFGFVSFDCFEASDAAIEAMNGQFLCNRSITVSYAYKKDTKGGRCGWWCWRGAAGWCEGVAWTWAAGELVPPWC
jgi:hypothetical protein